MAEEIAATIDLGVGEGLAAGGLGGSATTVSLLTEIRDLLQGMSRESGKQGFFGFGAVGGGALGTTALLTGLLGAGAGVNAIAEDVLPGPVKDILELLSVPGIIGAGAGLFGAGFDSLFGGAGAGGLKDLVDLQQELVDIQSDGVITQEEGKRLEELRSRLAKEQVSTAAELSARDAEGLEVTVEQQSRLSTIIDLHGQVLDLLLQQNGVAAEVRENYGRVSSEVAKANRELERSFTLIRRAKKEVNRKGSSRREREELTVKDDKTGLTYTGFVEELFGEPKFVGIRTVS